MVAPRAVDKLPTLLLLSLASTSASLTLPTLGSFRTTPTSARSPAATAYAVGPNPAAATRSKAPLRNMVAPAFSYAGLGAVAARAYGMVTFGAIAAPALLLLLEFIFLGGGERVAKMMGGERADSYVTGIANDVALKAGLPPPAHVFEIPTSELNAFAAGFGSKDATVAVTSGLRDALSKKELEAVIAHEIGHIRHSDMSTNMHLAVATAGLGGVYEAGRLLSRYSSESKSSGSKSKSKSESNEAGLMLMAGGATARILAHLMQLAMSRTAEYDADRVAAQLCGSEAMISALAKIEAAAKNRKRHQATAKSPLREGRATAFAHAYISSRALLHV